MFRNKGLLIGTAALIMLLLLGCSPAQAAPPASAQSTPVVQAFTTADPATGRCQVQVVIEGPGTAVELDVQVYAEPGILFEATGRTESEQQSVSMLATDRRELSFSCRLDPAAVRLSGAYVVRAVAAYQGSGRSYRDAFNRLYVMAPAGGTPRLLASREAFDLHYTEGYITGTEGIAYLADLDQARGQGTMYVRVPGAAVMAGPVLNVHAAGGFQFAALSPAVTTEMAGTHTILAQLPPIAEHGVRIVPIPFTVEPGVGPGNYNVEVTADYHNYQVAEVAPYYMQVAVDQATGGPSAITLVTGTAMALRSAPPAEMAPAPALPAPDQQAPELQQAAADWLDEAQAQPVPVESADAGWQYTITGFSGTSWGLFIQYVEPRSEMAWEEFKQLVAVYNPHLVSSGYLFYAEQSYLLPVPVDLPAAVAAQN